MVRRSLFTQPSNGLGFTFNSGDSHESTFATARIVLFDSSSKCVGFCPSGAQVNSTPTSGGQYAVEVAAQEHRFWDGSLQFDFGRCCEERGQLGSIYSAWSCAHCLTVCLDQGKRNPEAATGFYKQFQTLTAST